MRRRFCRQEGGSHVFSATTLGRAGQALGLMLRVKRPGLKPTEATET
jgi:hypothetical protein